MVVEFRRNSKRLEKMRVNPHGDWSIQDVEGVCREHDIACEKPTNGSHFKVKHHSQNEILTIRFKRPVKAVYIKKLIASSTLSGLPNGKLRL